VSGSPSIARRLNEWDRYRKPAAWTVFALAVIVTLASALTVWVKRQALDTDAWTKTSSELLTDDEIRGALSIYLVDQLYENVDVADRLADRLPPQLDPLAAPAAAGLRQVAIDLADDLLATDAVQTLWTEANRRAHEALIALLEGEEVGRVSLVDGAVVLNLQPLIVELRSRLGLTGAIPEDAGVITILEADEVDAAQRAVKAIRALTIFLALVALALFALALWLARGWRRAMLAACGGALLGIGVIVLIVRRLAGDALVDALTETPSFRPAVSDVWLLSTSMLRDLGLALVAYGIVALLAAWISSPLRLATAARRRLAPAFRSYPVAVFGAVALIMLLLLLWGPLDTGRRLVGTLVLAALILAGVEVLRRQTLREFPPAGSTPA